MYTLLWISLAGRSSSSFGIRKQGKQHLAAESSLWCSLASLSRKPHSIKACSHFISCNEWNDITGSAFESSRAWCMQVAWQPNSQCETQQLCSVQASRAGLARAAGTCMQIPAGHSWGKREKVHPAPKFISRVHCNSNSKHSDHYIPPYDSKSQIWPSHVPSSVTFLKQRPLMAAVQWKIPRLGAMQVTETKGAEGQLPLCTISKMRQKGMELSRDKADAVNLR